MKHLHLLPTDKPSRLYLNSENKIFITDVEMKCGNTQHVYITSDEEIKEGVDQWYLDKVLNEPYNSGGAQYSSKQDVIILTTDQDLIKDGVQVIDDEFLEWFVKNPSCESVDVKHFGTCCSNQLIAQCINCKQYNPVYKIIVPKEEPKYPIGGYAPGNYTCYCSTCKIEFQGDKRACQCEPCAVSMTKEEPKQETLEEAAEKWNEQQTTLEFGKPHNAPNRIKAFIAGAKWQAERMYSEEDMKQFGLYLGDNLKKLKGKTIDEIFEQFKNL